MAVRIQWRRDTAANWTTYNPVLADGEMGLETDTRKFKIGNGVDDWSTLLYMTIGLSAYEVAVDNGFVGTEEDWLDSLVGATGATGPAGADGIDGTNGIDGADGKSAYEVAVDNGFTGTEEDWLDSLIGPTGPAGADGADGATGPAGETGPAGPAGADGADGDDGIATVVAPITYDVETQTVGINQLGFDHIANIDYAQFDITDTTGSDAVGKLAWTVDHETLELQLDDAVTLQIGQEHLVRVKNSSGTTAITKGTVVMFAGSTGDTVTVAPFVSDGTVPAEYVVGITTETIAADGFGFVTQYGFINNLDTSVYTLGQILYPNPAVDGGLTATQPVAPAIDMPIAAVTRVHATTGRILVRVIPGQKLSQLYDVDLSTAPTDGQVLTFDDSTETWKAATPTGGSGGYPTITTAVKTTASIANNVNETGTITMEQGYRLLKIETDVAARVRLYTTTTGRDADIDRVLNTPFSESIGLLMDATTDSTLLSYDLPSLIDGYVASGTAIPITITNLSGATDTVTVTLTYVRTI